MYTVPPPAAGPSAGLPHNGPAISGLSSQHRVDGVSQTSFSPALPPATQPRSLGQWQPYPSSTHTITRGRYITSKDPRGYIPVWEYHLNGQWLMMDSENGYILWTGIWKALGNAKADIVKMIESLPELSPHLRRVRGGYLKIQGTWMPFEYAVNLARRVAWPIREDLVPFFGPSFPASCLSPSDPGYGRVVQPAGRRRRRTFTQDSATPTPPQPRASDALSPQHGGVLDALGQPVERPAALRIFTEPGPSSTSNHRYSPYPPAPAPPRSSRIPPYTATPDPNSHDRLPRDEQRRWSGSGASSPDSSTSASTQSSPLSPPSRTMPQLSQTDRPTLPSLSSLSLLPVKPLPPISSMAMLSSDPHGRYDLPHPASVLRQLRLDESASRRRQHASE